MASNPGRAVLERKRRSLERKHHEPYRVLIASNGEAAIMPEKYYQSMVNPKPTKLAENTNDGNR